MATVLREGIKKGEFKTNYQRYFEHLKVFQELTEKSLSVPSVTFQYLENFIQSGDYNESPL
ncbi:hypothetical protein AZF37_05030 [endosymbiont 'TC1' of Trimyema compressum]|nr:hypothetical protein AZF37_05030 [endosymbiont 'TC1' of Trimyema compressum]